MELHRYLQVALAKWYDVVLLMLIAAIGTYTYVEFNSSFKARTTVAVLEPSVASPLASQAAVITFPDIAKSSIVAERVAAAMDNAVTPGEVQSGIDVKLGRSMVQNLTTPLYTITVESKRKDIVVPLAEAVVKETRRAFVEINSLNPENGLKALDTLEVDFRADASRARQALTDFEQANSAFQLPRLIESQFSLANGLKISGVQQEGNRAQIGQAQSALSSRLSEAQGQLDRLRSLKVSFSDLQFQQQIALRAVSEGEAQVRGLSLSSDESLKGAIAGQLQRDKDRLSDIQRQMQEFERSNRIANFDAELGSALGYVDELRRQSDALRFAPTATNSRVQAEQEELERLMSLQPEYDRLARAVFRTTEQLEVIEKRRIEYKLAAINPIDNYVRPLDAAVPVSDTFFNIILYALGTIAGLVAGLLLVYLIAYFDRVPRTVEDVEDLLGIPTLGRVPQYRR